MRNSDLSKLRRKLAETKIESEKKDGIVFNYKVTTNIKYGETLVMGGYLNEAGNHEITFIMPKKGTGRDRGMITATTKVIEMGPNFSGTDGMNDTANILKSLSESAQAWTNDHVNELFKSFESGPNKDLPSDAHIKLM